MCTHSVNFSFTKPKSDTILDLVSGDYNTIRLHTLGWFLSPDLVANLQLIDIQSFGAIGKVNVCSMINNSSINLFRHAHVKTPVQLPYGRLVFLRFAATEMQLLVSPRTKSESGIVLAKS